MVEIQVMGRELLVKLSITWSYPERDMGRFRKEFTGLRGAFFINLFSHMKNTLVLGVGIFITGSFLYLVYKFLPLGFFLVIIGAGLATLTRQQSNTLLTNIGRFGSLLYPLGIVVSFIQNGILWGIASIVVGMMTYSYAKTKR